ADATVWLGTALGLSRWRQGQFTALPADPGLVVQGNAATLEAFFRAVAQAIFNAQPLSTVALGTVSFLDAFGRPLIKEDLIFSAAEDHQGRLWVGTLGGGLRRLEGDTQTLHLTRAEELGGNLILALTVGPDDTVWAATDEGVSRLREVAGQVTITNMSALDGLALPVRAVAVDGTGSVWVATDGGLFRLLPRGGRVEGVVRDASGRPVAGADVIVLGTPFRAVTDEHGHFVLTNLPPGNYSLEVDGRLAVGGPVTGTAVSIVVTDGEHTLAPVVLPEEGGGARLIEVSGNHQSGEPGQVLPEPLVVRLEDQFGNPLAGETVTATIVTGEGEFVSGQDASVSAGTTQTALTDTHGEAHFFLRIGLNEAHFVENRLAARDQEVRFLTLVGFISPLALAAEADGALLVVDTVLQAVVRVDPHSGERTLVSGRGRGSGSPFLTPWSIGVLPDGTLLVTDN